MPEHPVAPAATIGPRPTPHPPAPSSLPPPLPPPGTGPSGKERRHYREREMCGRYIRLLTHSRCYQLRIHSPPLATLCGHGMIHGGLFADLWSARRAREKFLALVRGDRPIDIWRAIAALQAAGAIPTGRRGTILPHFVRRHGQGFVAQMTRHGVTLKTRPMPTPESAHMSLWLRLTEGAELEPAGV